MWVRRRRSAGVSVRSRPKFSPKAAACCNAKRRKRFRQKAPRLARLFWRFHIAGCRSGEFGTQGTGNAPRATRTARESEREKRMGISGMVVGSFCEGTSDVEVETSNWEGLCDSVVK